MLVVRALLKSSYARKHKHTTVLNPQILPERSAATEKVHQTTAGRLSAYNRYAVLKPALGDENYHSI